MYFAKLRHRLQPCCKRRRYLCGALFSCRSKKASLAYFDAIGGVLANQVEQQYNASEHTTSRTADNGPPL
jgi:hypothetical protein